MSGEGSESGVARPVPSPPRHPLTQPVPVVGGETKSSSGGGATAAKREVGRRRRRRRRGRVPQTAIVFIGPMAAGKTSLGRRVAKELEIPFVDTDAVFVRQHGPIADFFTAHGEDEFRRLEAEIVAEEVQRPGARIVALGGGSVLAASTRELLHRHPVVLLMTTQAAVLRTANLSRRPLLRDDPESWGRILEARRPLYEEVADVTFRTDRAAKEQLAQQVIGWLRGQSPSRGRGRRGSSRANRVKANAMKHEAAKQSPGPSARPDDTRSTQADRPQE